MFKLALSDSEKLVLFDLLIGIDEEDRHIDIDNAEQKLISDIVIQMEPHIEVIFSDSYKDYLREAKKEILTK